MHWTVSAFTALVALSFVMNAIQAVLVGSVRPLGLAVCIGWAAQQYYWIETGENSLVMFFLCDGIILWLATRDRHWTALATAALMLVCWACYGPAALWFSEKEIWWANWTAVFLQMALGLPWPALQRIGDSISHGPVKGAV